MIYIEEAIKKFNNLPVEARVEFNKLSVINAVENIEAKYKISLSFLIIYIAIDELKTLEEISNFLVRECDIDEEKAKEIIKEVDQNVLRPIIDKLLFLGSDPNKPMDILKEREIVVGIFREKIVEELDNIFIVIEEINSRIFYILARDLEFKKELENALYVNNEKLTSQKFILDNKPHSPSVANWLKDFIKKNGSGMFDNLVLTEYLINSDNAKKLDSKGREILKKLLLLYRNIKFFPESMPTDIGEGWEIIPVNKIGEEKVKTQASGMDSLVRMAEQYPAGSLERKAVEEELVQEKKVLPIEQSTPAVADKEIYIQHPASEDIAVKGASFFFSPDDETEIRELTKKINNYSKIALPEEALLDQIISKTEINFGSDALAERFKQILKIYLRGIRNKIETKQTLIKPFENGGLSFDEISAEQVLFIVDDRLKNFDQLLKPKPLVKIVAPEFKKETVASLKDIGARDFEYDLATIVKQKKESEATTEPILKKDVLKKLDIDHELAPLCPAVVKAVKSVETAKKQAPQSLKKDVFQKDINLPVSQIKRPRTETGNKIKMEDVKFVPRVMGPIDELRYLDLINFRRLSSEVGKAIEKIKEKINLLEEESYAKRLEGIKAWRSCPVSKLYLDIGQFSISANKPINVIIEERKKRHKEYLTSEEFEAIVDLNKSLRF